MAQRAASKRRAASGPVYPRNASLRSRPAGWRRINRPIFHRLPRQTGQHDYYVLDRTSTRPDLLFGRAGDGWPRALRDAPPDIPVDPWRVRLRLARGRRAGRLRASARRGRVLRHCASHTRSPCRPPIHHRTCRRRSRRRAGVRAGAQPRQRSPATARVADAATIGTPRRMAPARHSSTRSVADRVEAVYITSRKYAARMCPPARSPPAARRLHLVRRGCGGICTTRNRRTAVRRSCRLVGWQGWPRRRRAS